MTFPFKRTPETERYWEGAEQGRLHIPRCTACGGHFFPPAPVCPHCSSKAVEWVEASGRGTLYSYSIPRLTWPFWGDGPQSLAIVELAEGARLISTIVDCEQTPESLIVDMPLVATWRRAGPEGSQAPNLLCFRKAATGTST